MAGGANEITADIVRFTTRQIECLALATGTSLDDIRRAQRMMPVKGDFPLSLGYVHMSHDPHIARIDDGRQRHLSAMRAAIDLSTVWNADERIKAIFSIGSEQARTGQMVRDEPSLFKNWLERVWSSHPVAGPSPTMRR